MQWSVARNLLAVLAAAALAGCGGSSSNKNAVAVVNLAPASISIVAGQVVQLSVSAVNASNNTVATTFTFNSSNPTLVSVSPSGLVCGGVWDSTFVTCNGNDSSGNPLTGSAVITATAAGVTSAPVSVSVHQTVTSIQVTAGPFTGPNPCISHAQTQQFSARAFHGSMDITPTVGQFTWASSDNSVASVDANGLATANDPGLSQIIASVGSVTSQSTPFNTCMPVRIILHLTTDAAGQPTEAVSMSVNDTKTLQADMTDENGVVTVGAPVSLFTNNGAVATITGPTSGATLTAVSAGGAGIQAVCAPPKCGNGINRPVYSNLFSVTIGGPSPATTVYVGTTTAPAAGTKPAIVPIDTSKTPPAAGTAVNLPGTPTSMAFSADGSKLYVDTTAGLVSIDPNSNAATLVDADPVGAILAVSRDGTKVIVSNAKSQPDVPSQRLFIFDSSNNTLQTFILPGAVAAAFDNDGFKAYIAANFLDSSNNRQARVYVWSPFLTLRTLTATGTPNSVAPIAAGPLTFISNGSAVNVFNVCDNSASADVATTSAPQLVGTVKNSNTIVAVNQTGIDIENVNLADTTIGQCPPPVSYGSQFIDFLVGPFTARQLLVASDFTHVVVLPVGMNQVLVDGPSASVIPLVAGATDAVSGDLTQDGNTLWAGVGGTNTVDRINLLTGADEFQLQLNLNQTNATPDLLAVRPK